MVRLLSKLLNIRPAEWPRLLIFYIMLFIYVSGWVWASTILEAAFLQQPQLGVGALPWFFVIKGIVAIPAIAIYAAFADRVTNIKLLLAILIASAVIVAAGLILLGWGLVTLAYPLLFLVVFVPLDDIFFTHWYTYVNDFYDTRSAKRLIPALVTAVGLSGSFAGLTMPLLNDWLGSPYRIIFVWLCTLLIVALLAWLMPYLLREHKTGSESAKYTTPLAAAAEKQRPSHLDNIREGYRYVTESTFLRSLALSALVLLLLHAFLQYQTSQILQDQLKTTENFSNFTGRLMGVTYLIMLPIQLFLLSRIIGRVGLGNANLIYPASNLAICGGLILAPGLPTAALGYFSRTNFYGIIGYTIESLLYNAVPLRVKGRGRAFIGGLVVPIGSLMGGLLLLTPLTTIWWFLPVAIGALATAFLINALIIRKQYSQALIKMLEEEDFSFLLSQETAKLTVTDPATLQSLQKKLSESTSHEFTIFMAKLISQIGGSAAIPILGQAARATTDARSRAAILDVLVAADTRGDAMRQLYTDFLHDDDGRVRQSALAGLEQLIGPQDKQFLALASTMLTDPDTEVRARVLPVLLQADDPIQQSAATQALNEFLTDQDTHQRARGLHVLSQTHDLRFINILLDHLADPADEVRLEAALTVESLISEKMPAQAIELILERTKRLIQDPVERIRQAALNILGRIGERESHQIVINALTDPSLQVRTTAVDTLVQIGKAIIPRIHPALNSPNPLLRKMTTVALSRINRREFGPLVETQITGNLLDIYRGNSLLAALTPCAGYPSISVLQSALQEQNKQLLDEIFYLLAAIHGTEAVRIVAESFESETPRVRANAAEAMEALTTPQTARLVAPLFEPEMTLAQLLEISQETWDMVHPQPKEAIHQLLTAADDPWLRAIMTLALGEMGVTLLPPPASPSQPSTVKIHEVVNQRLEEMVDVNARDLPAAPDSPVGAAQQEDNSPRRPRPGNLFDALAETSDHAQPNVEPKPKEPPSARRFRPADLLNALTDPGSDNKPAPDSPAEEPKPRRLRPGNLLGALLDTPDSASTPPVDESPTASTPLPFTAEEIERLIEKSFADPQIDVRLAARAARRIMAGSYITSVIQEEGLLLSPVEKIIFLKEVPFFEGMTIDQLKVLANVCEEQLFEEDAHIFNTGDPGGALYVVVSGRVGIEQEKRKGSFARLATMEAHSYFGEMNLFDNSPRSTTAVALQDTLTLRLRREPLIALARQYPDLSLELINVLSQRLREANDRVADLTRTRPRELHKLFDKFD